MTNGIRVRFPFGSEGKLKPFRVIECGRVIASAPPNASTNLAWTPSADGSEAAEAAKTDSHNAEAAAKALFNQIMSLP